MGFPEGSVVKHLPANVEGMDLIPGSGKSPGEGNGNPLHYSCLGNPMNRRSLGGYSPWSHKRVEDNLASKQQYSIVYMYHIFCIHFPVNGNLGCFHVLAIVNSAGMNIRVHASF